jgi:radical SAM protein with 4Fe4S-binding SPASM domain
MINTVCSVKWSQDCDVGYRILTPTSTLPPEFQLLSERRYTDQIFKRALCPCCRESAVSLVVSLIYQKAALFLDCTLIYCLQTQRLILTRNEEFDLSTRWEQMRKGGFVSLQRRRVGVGDRITEPLVSSEAGEFLGISSPTDGYYSAMANAITSGLVLPERGGELPTAIGFFSNDLPEQITLKIEPTTRCNFRCEFCYGRYIEQGSLRIQDFFKILDQVPGVQAVEITGEGEPLVNRHIFEMIEACASRGIWTHITTNGSLVTESTCARLLSSGLSSIAISLESIDPVQFARLRPGGTLESVVEAIRTILHLREGRKAPLEFGLWVTILRETLMQVDRIDEFAKELGVDYVQFQTLNPMSSYKKFYSEELRKNILSLDEMKSLIADVNTSPVLRSALSSVTSTYHGKKCAIFTHTLMVYWQGDVTPCCLLKPPHFQSYGNLTRESFNEIWNRKDYRFFRFALQHGLVLHSCRDCPDVASA